MQKKIKVLHVIKSLGRGGAEMLLPETLEIHNKEAFEFHYVYFLPWKDQMVNALREKGGVVTCFSANNNIQILLQYRKIVAYIRRNGIDIIHAHLPWAGFLSRVVHKLTRIPVFYTEHNKQERYHSVTYWLNRLTFNWQTMAIAVSDDVASSIKSRIRTEVPVKTVLNGVNTQRFVRNPADGLQVRRQCSIPEDAVVVGTVAVFRFQKRLLEWLEVMGEVCAQDERIYGIIVGDGPLKREIIEKRAELGLEDRVIMPGLITDVRPWISAMDIYMMSSVFEGLPVALLEGMSMGCAVATTDAGGIKEVVRNGQDGLTVPVDEWKQLAKLVLQISRNRQVLAENARLRVIQSFSLERMVQELELIYVEAVEPTRPGSVQA